MRSSLKFAGSAGMQQDAVVAAEVQRRLESFFSDPFRLDLSWAALFSELRCAGAIVRVLNGEASISLGERHILTPKSRSPSLTTGELDFVRRSLGIAVPNRHAPLDLAPDPQEDLRVVAAIDDRAARIFRIIVSLDAPRFLALEPYDRHLFERCYFPPVTTMLEGDGAYFEVLSMALAPARQILLVERGVSTAGQRLLHFLRKHHSPIAARMVGGAAFGAPGGTDRALLGLARRYFGTS